jgi:predicted MFS family arabinose efflux permease
VSVEVRTLARPAPAVPFSASSCYRAYVLALLIAVGVVGWVDRNVFAVLLESMKRDLAFTDTQLGLLGGAAFGVFYAAVGLPVAWLADRYSRRSLIAAAIALWSGMTALCGAANGFTSLLLARVGVGIGEAGGSPPSQSLVADYFPPDRRAFALGVLYLYIPLGFLIGYAAGGWLADQLGWRLTFAVVGLPGLLLAVVVRLTLRDPPRGFSEGRHVSGAPPSIGSTLLLFWRTRSLRNLAAAGAAHGIGAFAAAVWVPSFLARAFGLSSTEVGALMALAYGGAGGVGVLCGGYVLDHVVRRTGDRRWYSWGSALAIAAALPPALLLYTTDSVTSAALGLIGAALFGHLFLGPVTAQIQTLVEPRRRAVAAAVYLFLVNLLSMGLGPVAVGFASDRFGALLGGDALRYALAAIVALTSVWAAAHFALAARTLPSDLARGEGEP